MTILCVKNALFSHFLSHDTFLIERDIDAINIFGSNEKMGVDDKADIDAIKADILRAALRDFVASNVVKELSPDAFMLTMPIANLPQSVTISASTVNVIIDTLNIRRAEESGDADDQEKSFTTTQLDKFNISGNDIDEFVAFTLDLLENLAMRDAEADSDEDEEENKDSD